MDCNIPSRRASTLDAFAIIKDMTRSVFLSAHLDDAVYSCGGLIARQTSAGEKVLILTVCAGDAPGPLSAFARQLHARWNLPRDPVLHRREEDLAACTLLGAEALHGTIPDAVYRLDPSGAPRYPDEAAIFAELHPHERRLAGGIAAWLDVHLQNHDVVYAPLGLGGHVDHVLVRKAAERLRKPIYYPDYPYAGEGVSLPSDIPMPQGLEEVVRLTPLEIHAWVQAALCYTSQLSTFWSSPAAMEAAFRSYHESAGGLRLFVPDTTTSE